MRGSSEVRFVSVFTVFFQCRTFCALIARRVEKSRKNSRFGLEKQGLGRPGEPRTSKFERKNGQVERKNEAWAHDALPFLKSECKRERQSEKKLNCLRFAHPAEADWRLEVGKPAHRYLGSIRLWNSRSLDPWNGVE